MWGRPNPTADNPRSEEAAQWRSRLHGIGMDKDRAPADVKLAV
jgi:hypothetical protein